LRNNSKQESFSVDDFKYEGEESIKERIEDKKDRANAANKDNEGEDG
jgi:hypothetical protein|tara:strand:+ start:90 stop:230 length:141 start_codon:yes stop_codon:yes gene_type:complete